MRTGRAPRTWSGDFHEALHAGLQLAGELLPLEWGERETLLLLATVAAFKGVLGLSRAIECGGVWCPTCQRVVKTPRYHIEE